MQTPPLTVDSNGPTGEQHGSERIGSQLSCLNQSSIDRVITHHALKPLFKQLQLLIQTNWRVFESSECFIERNHGHAGFSQPALRPASNLRSDSPPNAREPPKSNAVRQPRRVHLR